MAAPDEFRGREAHLCNPLTKFSAVTPNDSVDLPWVSRAIFIGVAGNVSLIGKDDAAAVVVPLDKGMHSIRASRILSTNTTATGIVAAS